jgi:hypothetical protein
MTGKKEFELDINLSGKVDNSVANALNMTTSQLSRFQSKIKQINKLSQQVNLNANGIGALPSKLKETNVHASRMRDIFNKIATSATAFALGGFVVMGVAAMADGAKRFADFMSVAIQKAGQFTRTKEQLAIELGKDVNDPYVAKIMNQAQQDSFSTHLVPDAVIEAFRSTKKSGFSDDETFKHIQESANISSATVPHGENASQSFLDLMDAYNRADKGGAALERTLYMLEKRGVGIRGLIAKNVGMELPDGTANLDPDDPRAAAIDTALAKAIKARKVPFSAIGEAITQLGGPGGKYGNTGDSAVERPTRWRVYSTRFLRYVDSRDRPHNRRSDNADN